MRWIVLPLFVACAEEEPVAFDPDCTGADPFAVGMAATSDAGLRVVLESADPAPTDVGDNTWQIAVTDADGAPVTGITPRVRPFMPLHGHGVVPTHYEGAEVADGVYAVETFDLIMPGVWELWVELPEDDAAMFALCAEG